MGGQRSRRMRTRICGHTTRGGQGMPHGTSGRASPWGPLPRALSTQLVAQSCGQVQIPVFAALTWPCQPDKMFRFWDAFFWIDPISATSPTALSFQLGMRLYAGFKDSILLQTVTVAMFSWCAQVTGYKVGDHKHVCTAEEMRLLSCSKWRVQYSQRRGICSESGALCSRHARAGARSGAAEGCGCACRSGFASAAAAGAAAAAAQHPPRAACRPRTDCPIRCPPGSLKCSSWPFFSCYAII